MSSVLDSLNKQQLAAVTSEAKHLLVLAGAGSGKTKVLTTRIAWLVQQGIATPERILAVTFTNKAAKEMMERIGKYIPINPKSLWVGTFHSICHRILRAHHKEVGLPAAFQILDMADQKSMLKRILKSMKLDDDKLYPIREVQYGINNKKESGLRAEQVIPTYEFDETYVEIYKTYEKQCQKEGVVDFAELLLRTVELLENNKTIRGHYNLRFKHILIDEFQDTNFLQYKWLNLLAGPSTSIFAVGDDDQSIYSFRGANVEHMRNFERKYAKENLVRLEQNYRSYNHILCAANELIANNTNRLGKNLWSDKGQGEQISIASLYDQNEEAQWILEETKQLIREGFDHRQIAILYRSNAQSRAIEHSFARAGVKYVVYGGLRFYERQEIKHVVAYLQLIHNLNSDNAFLRVVNFPARSIGNRTIEKLDEIAKSVGCSLALAAGGLNGEAAKKVNGFIYLIKRLQEVAAESTLPELVEAVIEQTGIDEYYNNEQDGEERLENLSELIDAAKVFCKEEGIAFLKSIEVIEGVDAKNMTPLALFLSTASLEAGDNQSKRNLDAVQLMTVHSSKGLEFDAVFIAGLEQGLFPHDNSISEPGGLEEERRLMYVAMTRARKRLYLLFTMSRQIYGKTHPTKKSIFLDEITKDHVKWLTDKPQLYSDSRYSLDSFEEFASPKTKEKIYHSDSPYRIGMSVSHPKFGEGVIIKIIGQGDDAQAQIQFFSAGTKTLSLSVAKLSII
ncbi:UvrD-helicase domain-containing protein [Taylorella equigenitalis]|uniref:UvrD-helicase domain-containing protein n=1 Tax=Taylorella equigenitalis TaxID=29575 RepID=UPI00237C6B46|nr:UvrD-helicase domain-containing protein [Taylorella equigenitalis]WDU45889.1 UvrD-helicase domain-containing protein [Taylorella equigenitalis]WDU48880.1 UvrD-helicase domain-containing protein [Taylorella equigenitalis]